MRTSEAPVGSTCESSDMASVTIKRLLIWVVIIQFPLSFKKASQLSRWPIRTNNLYCQLPRRQTSPWVDEQSTITENIIKRTPKPIISWFGGSLFLIKFTNGCNNAPGHLANYDISFGARGSGSFFGERSRRYVHSSTFSSVGFCFGLRCPMYQHIPIVIYF
ncbi:hypothetical protein FHS18_005518 [Paenibacillus phyllosphaerae]|uniref:Uncharacterized protein n=1 Tax=Paenibacillus phyllosphaerae TaxID=274593 RepID=A0A7W5B476_9BACL|nr:hypothetical protein [Paenibacillus phyllosphaerae]